MKVDHRILRRRLAVAEAQALSRVRRSVISLLVMGGAGLVVWFLLSPYMSVASVEVTGDVNGEVGVILEREKVVMGTPLVTIRTDRIEESLLDDPWIRTASVKLVFPTRVEVHVREREAAAWLWSGETWVLLADDGVLLDHSETPDPVRSIIAIPTGEIDVGSRMTDEAILGALEFARYLPQAVGAETMVQARGDELWGLVGDRPVRLGLPVQMAAKAVSLAAVLETVPEGLIDMTAPGRPAIRLAGPGQPPSGPLS